MRLPCDHKINCECSELPLSNFSSEDPDRLIFLGRHYGFPGIPKLGEDPGTSGCTTFSTSTLTQTDADLCAEFTQNECAVADDISNPCQTCRGSSGSGGTGFGLGLGMGFLSTEGQPDPCCEPDADVPKDCCCDSNPSNPNDPPTGGGPDKPVKPDEPTGPRLFCNDPQTCTADCPDGGLPYTATVPACRFNATSKAMANRIAHSAACFEAEQFRICTDSNYGGGNPCKVVCVDGYFELQLNASSRADLGLSWAVTGGSLPNGVTMDGSGKISGTPSTSGQSTSATVTITDESGHTQTREICFSVMDLSPDALPDGDCGAAYNAAVSASGGYLPYAFSLGGGTLPDGLTVNANGTITGTPTEKGDFFPIITVTDHLGNVCSKEMSLTINGITNTAQTKTVPCIQGGSNIIVTVPAGTFCVPTGTPLGQDLVNAQAQGEATNRGAAILAAAGCTCYVSAVNTPTTIDHNAPWITITGCNPQIRLSGPYDHINGTNLGGSVGPLLMASPSPWSWCDLYTAFFLLPCALSGSGQIFHLTTQAGGDLGWYVN